MQHVFICNNYTFEISFLTSLAAYCSNKQNIKRLSLSDTYIQEAIFYREVSMQTFSSDHIWNKVSTFYFME